MTSIENQLTKPTQFFKYKVGKAGVVTKVQFGPVTNENSSNFCVLMTNSFSLLIEILKS